MAWFIDPLEQNSHAGIKSSAECACSWPCGLIRLPNRGAYEYSDNKLLREDGETTEDRHRMRVTSMFYHEGGGLRSEERRVGLRMFDYWQLVKERGRQ